MRLDGLHVLVVDDEADSREMVADALAQAGAVVSEAPSAADALRLLADERIDVLLADISMPETDGYMLLRQVRSHPNETIRQLPAIAVTAHAREEDRQRAEEAGFQVHVAKPVDIAALRDAVRRLVAAV
jgi:CheY-like chemotaxis protein